MQRIYLDNAATTPIDDNVLEAMLPYLKENFGNPSSIHFFGRAPKAAIEKARKTVAKYLNASTGEVFFTSGGTESNNTALRCAVASLGVKRIITTQAEHDCVLKTAHALSEEGIELIYLPVDETGKAYTSDLEKIIQKPLPTLVSIMHVNNETGAINDIEEIALLCKKYHTLFHTDTVQSIGYYHFDLQKLPIHFMSGSAHKFHGPKGAGFLYIRQEVQMKPLITGGGQERNMRAGTENVASIAGLGQALENASQNIESNLSHMKKLKQKMKKLLSEKIPDVSFIGNDENTFVKILNVSFPPHPKNEMLLMNLDLSGIAASGGSACSSGTEKGSHVLQAIGADEKRKYVRFSFSKYNTIEEIEFTVQAIASCFN
ncbi:MAG: cysteine desulfurase family protein [Chitinophagales bacterium]|nr:cysteine desulfurase [Chitinophagales bacterium]MDW8273611.1 cysteine desulfurase family protein [Chitinophagales bacterium]